MKAFTDIEQSKKLAEILPLESADMFYDQYGVTRNGKPKERYSDYHQLPVWSLAALLDALPQSIIYTPNQVLAGYCCKNIIHDLETYGDNPIDACVEMIVKLNELKML